MNRRQLHPKSISRWSLVVGLLCVLLVVLAGTLNVAHGHDRDSVDHADCGLCAAAHVSVQIAATTALVSAPLVKTRVEAFVPEARPRNLARFALFTRPPPSLAHLIA
jgi:hypothetical protein